MKGPSALWRDVGATMSRHLVSVLAALVMTPVLVRSIGAARLGFWSLLGTSAFLVGLADLGLTSATLRAATGEDPAAAKRAARLAALVTAIVSVPVVLGCGAWLLGVTGELPVEQRTDARLAVLVALAAGVVNAVCQPARAYGQGQGKLSLLAKARAVAVLAQTATTIAALYVRSSLTSVAVGYAVFVLVEGVASIAATADAHASRGWPSPAQRRALFSVGRSALLTNVSVALCVRADILILQRVTTLEAIGAYSVASRVVDQGFTLVKQISSAFVPRLGARSRDRGAVIRLGTMLLGAVAAAPLAALAVAGGPVVVLWAGRAVDQPILPVALAWLGLAAIIASAEEVACSGLALGGDHRVVARAFMIGTATNVLLSVAGAWVVGPGAVAAATAVGNAVMAYVVWRATSRAHGWGPRILAGVVSPTALAALVAALIAVAATRASLSPVSAVGAAALAGFGVAALQLRRVWRSTAPVPS